MAIVKLSKTQIEALQKVRHCTDVGFHISIFRKPTADVLLRLGFIEETSFEQWGITTAGIAALSIVEAYNEREGHDS